MGVLGTLPSPAPALPQPRRVGAGKTLLGETAPRPLLFREALNTVKRVGKEKFASPMSAWLHVNESKALNPKQTWPRGSHRLRR